jgi:hypothetical protein
MSGFSMARLCRIQPAAPDHAPTSIRLFSDFFCCRRAYAAGETGEVWLSVRVDGKQGGDGIGSTWT